MLALLPNRKLQILFIAMAVAAIGCARQPDPSVRLSPDELGLAGQLAGFLVGLFHGFIIVFNILASLFFDVRIYAFPNSGRLYDFGYVLGAATFLGGWSSTFRIGRNAIKRMPESVCTISVTCPSCGHRWLIRPSDSRLPL